MSFEPVFLCNISDLSETQARSVELSINERTIDIMVVTENSAIYVYLDRCPHAGTPLEWREHDFLSEDKQHIVCATHGARFQIHDGLCVAGPCKKKSLTHLKSEIRDGKIHLLESPLQN